MCCGFWLLLFALARYMRKPRLMTMTAFLNEIRLSYEIWRNTLLSALDQERLKADNVVLQAADQQRKRARETVQALTNLVDLMEVVLPTMHDYLCNLKASG
jgi:hypothetical protein